MFKYPDQVAAFWHRSGHVVETTGAEAIAGEIAEGGHRVVLNEISNRIIPPRGALVKGASSVLPKAMRGSENPVRRRRRQSQARPYWDLDSV
jgi:hypothetical protein